MLQAKKRHESSFDPAKSQLTNEPSALEMLPTGQFPKSISSNWPMKRHSVMSAQVQFTLRKGTFAIRSQSKRRHFVMMTLSLGRVRNLITLRSNVTLGPRKTLLPSLGSSMSVRQQSCLQSET
jgi:hypothetical protein